MSAVSIFLFLSDSTLAQTASPSGWAQGRAS